MKDPLKNLVIGFTGNFGGAVTHQKLQQWIERNGGVSTDVMNEETTHLICTKEDWNKKVPKVRKAEKLDHVKVVSYDWLDDSLRKRHKQREARYLLPRLVKADRKKHRDRLKAAKAGKERFAQSSKDGAEELLSAEHHIYCDDTAFEHSIVMTRVDLDAGSVERYKLKLYESNARPCSFATSIVYTRPGHTGKAILAPIGSEFDHAFAEFRKFFKNKTGIDWESRLDGLEPREHFFRYFPPDKKLPQGAMPMSVGKTERKGEERCLGRVETESKGEDRCAGTVAVPGGGHDSDKECERPVLSLRLASLTKV